MSLLPMVLLLLAQAPAPLAGTAIDREGRPLAGVEIVLARGQAPDGTVPILGRATTDSQGRYEIVAPAFDRRPTGRVALAPFLSAYRPGSGLVASVTLLKKADPGEYRLAFDAAGRRTFTLRGGDGRPLAGVRLAPLTVPPRQSGYLYVTLPEALADRMEVKTGLDGRAELARTMARDDPEEAAAVAESIPQAFRRAQALVDVCVSMPDDQRAKKRQLIDRVLLSARAEPVPKLRVWQLGEAAELLLELGETDRAKAIFAEGRPIAERLGPDAIEFVGYFASRLGRVDLPAALALLGGVDQAESHVVAIGNLAARIAASNPAEAERLVRKIRGLIRSFGVTLRTCQNMARADLSRARRIAMDQESAGLRAGALIFTAYGLPSSERQAARDLVRQALAEMDRARDEFDWYRSHSSAYMPMLESIDPALVPELFWRTAGTTCSTRRCSWPATTVKSPPLSSRRQEPAPPGGRTRARWSRTRCCFWP